MTRPGPQTIAHRAGNNRVALERAVSAGVDWVEADIWWHFGRLDARHEHALWRLPLRYDEWKLGLALRRPPCLADICDYVTGGPRLLIDFKGDFPRLALDVVALLQAKESINRAAICGQNWRLLDLAVSRAPDLKAFYSIGSVAQLEALLHRSPDLPAIRAVSCAQALLTSVVLHQLLDRGIEVFAWTVNERPRALELVEAGAAGIISDSYEVLRAVARAKAPSSG
jgi:hypothetical protein